MELIWIYILLDHLWFSPQGSQTLIIHQESCYVSHLRNVNQQMNSKVQDWMKWPLKWREILRHTYVILVNAISNTAITRLPHCIMNNIREETGASDAFYFEGLDQKFMLSLSNLTSCRMFEQTRSNIVFGLFVCVRFLLEWGLDPSRAPKMPGSRHNTT